MEYRYKTNTPIQTNDAIAQRKQSPGVAPCTPFPHVVGNFVVLKQKFLSGIFLTAFTG
jgi:hypothetical protein